MIKVAIADDHQLFREGIASLLSSNEDFSVVASASNGLELIQLIENGESPHVILLDLSMPVLDGFEVLKIVKSKYSNIKCIALSMHDDGNYIVKCVKGGAYGYLLKNADEEELTLAIKTVVNGKKYFNKEISEKMINNMSLEGTETKKLSSKEEEILGHIAEGATTKEIAELLFISTRTVETHRANMMKKLDVKNTAELIKKAAKLHII